MIGADRTTTLVYDDDIVGGGSAVTARGEFVFDLLPFVESRQAGLFEGGDVDESVLAAVVGLNETKPLCGIEPLYGSSRHCCSSCSHNADRPLRGRVMLRCHKIREQLAGPEKACEIPQANLLPMEGL